MNKIKITTLYIKLDSLLKLAGSVSTGGEAKNLILDGCVKLNDNVVLERGKKIYRSDIITINDDIKIEVE